MLIVVVAVAAAAVVAVVEVMVGTKVTLLFSVLCFFQCLITRITVWKRVIMPFKVINFAEKKFDLILTRKQRS